jgi:hypothetical protein
MVVTPAWCLFALAAVHSRHQRQVALSFFIGAVSIISDIAYLGSVRRRACARRAVRLAR